MDILPLLSASQADSALAISRSLLHDLSAVAISLSLLSSTPRPAKELKRIAKAFTKHGGAEEAALASECQAILARWRSFATATSGGSTSSAASTSSSSSASASSASSATAAAEKPHDEPSSMMAAVGFEAQNLALSAPMERDVDQFATDFLHCMSAWHTGQLRAQDPPPGQPADAPDELRFTDAASLTTLIGSATRATHLGKDLSRKHARSCGCGPCVKGRRVRAAFDGNMNAQFQPYVEESCVTQHHITPGIYPLYTFIAVYAPICTRYTCIYTIYTPLNTSKHPIYTLYTPQIHHYTTGTSGGGCPASAYPPTSGGSPSPLNSYPPSTVPPRPSRPGAPSRSWGGPF